VVLRFGDLRDLIGASASHQVVLFLGESTEFLTYLEAARGPAVRERKELL
jgi:hypothetical protein